MVELKQSVQGYQYSHFHVKSEVDDYSADSEFPIKFSLFLKINVF